jgi:hypothetical protein
MPVRALRTNVPEGAKPQSNLSRLLARLGPGLDLEGKKALVATLDLQEPTVVIERDPSRATPTCAPAWETESSTLAELMRMQDREWALAALTHPSGLGQPMVVRRGGESRPLWRVFAAEALARGDVELLREGGRQPGGLEGMRECFARWRSGTDFALLAFAQGSKSLPFQATLECAAWVKEQARDASGVRIVREGAQESLLREEMRDSSAQQVMDRLAQLAAACGSEGLARAALELGALPKPENVVDALFEGVPSVALAYMEAGWGKASLSERYEAVDQMARRMESRVDGVIEKPKAWAFLGVARAVLEGAPAWGERGEGAPWARLAAASMKTARWSNEGIAQAAWEKQARELAPTPAPEELLWLAKQGRWGVCASRAKQGGSAGVWWARAMSKAFKDWVKQSDAERVANVAWILQGCGAPWEAGQSPIDTLKWQGWTQDKIEASWADWEARQLRGQSKTGQKTSKRPGL